MGKGHVEKGQIGLRHLGGVSKESAADIVRALVKLELVVIEKGRPKLNRKGRELVELKILQ